MLQYIQQTPTRLTLYLNLLKFVVTHIRKYLEIKPSISILLFKTLMKTMVALA